MKNIKELRDVLIANAEKLSNDEISIAKSAEFSNIAGKLMSSCKLEMDYCKNLGISRRLEFMDYGSEETTAGAH